MKLLIGGFIALVSSGSVGAEPLLEGRVRLSSGQPAVGVQVRLFDLADMSQTPQMYWTHQTDETEGTGKIQRANLDGSNIETLISGLDKPFGLALDVTGGKVYWTGQDKIQRAKIQRANLDGSNIEALVTEEDGLGFPASPLVLDVAGGKMYWTVWGTSSGLARIQCANLDGSNVEDVVIGLDKPFGLALDLSGSKMYWTDWFEGKIQRANLDGSNIEALVTAFPLGLALDLSGDKMYWTGGDKIQRANLDGSNTETLVSTEEDDVGFSRYLALNVSGGKMYWTGGDKIQRANLDGSNIETLVTLITGLEALTSIVIAP